MNSPSKAMRLGTRGSPLALAQARMVRDALLAAHGWGGAAVEIVTITTSGDRIQDRALAEVGGKALWTKELDRALVGGEIDFAVHSMKDVETIRPSEIALAAMLERADVRDRLIGAPSLEALPHAARLGTSSPRRTAQLLRLRPDLQPVLLRGNVATRIARIEAGDADVTLLAAAGLDRLGLGDIGHALDLLPAPAQGAIGIETLAANERARLALGAINHSPTFICVMAERALLKALNADCHSPVAALAQIEDGAIQLRAEILLPGGSECQAGVSRFSSEDQAGPAKLAEALLAKASPALRAIFG